MILWLDAQLSPALAPWIKETFGLEAVAVRDVGLRDARDSQIFKAAKTAGAIVVTKDADFPYLLARHGPPPKILWLTCGNTSNANLRRILSSALPQALKQLDAGEALVEIAAPLKWHTG